MKVIYEGKIPLKVFLFGGGLIKFLICGWNICLITSILKSRSNYLKIDEESITYIKGTISQDEERIELFRIKDTKYKQGFLERILGIGKITIISDDDSASIIEIPIQNPKAVLDELRPLIRRDRKNMKAISID